MAFPVAAARSGTLSCLVVVLLLGVVSPAQATFSVTLKDYSDGVVSGAIASVPTTNFAVWGDVAADVTGVGAASTCGGGTAPCVVSILDSADASLATMVCSLSMVKKVSASASRLYVFVTDDLSAKQGTAVKVAIPAGCFKSATDTSAVVTGAPYATLVATSGVDSAQPKHLFSTVKQSASAAELVVLGTGAGTYVSFKADTTVQAYFSEGVSTSADKATYSALTGKFSLTGGAAAATLTPTSVTNGVATVKIGTQAASKVYTLTATDNSLEDGSKNYLTAAPVAVLVNPTTVSKMWLQSANSGAPPQTWKGVRSVNITENTKVILEFADGITTATASKLKFNPTAPGKGSLMQASVAPLLLNADGLEVTSGATMLIADMPLTDSNVGVDWQMGWDQGYVSYLDAVDSTDFAVATFKGANFSIQVKATDSVGPALVKSYGSVTTTSYTFNMYFDEKVQKTTNSTFKAVLTAVGQAKTELVLSSVLTDTAKDKGKLTLVASSLMLGVDYTLVIDRRGIEDASGNKNVAQADITTTFSTPVAAPTVTLTGETSGSLTVVPVTASFKVEFADSTVVARSTGNILVGCSGSNANQTISVANADQVLIQGKIVVVIPTLLPAASTCVLTVKKEAFVGLAADVITTFLTHDVDNEAPTVVSVGCGSAAGSCTDGTFLKAWKTPVPDGNLVYITFSKPMWGNAAGKVITLSKSGMATPYCFYPNKEDATGTAPMASVTAVPSSICGTNAGKVTGLGTQVWTLKKESLDSGEWTLTIPKDAVVDKSAVITARPEGNQNLAATYSAKLTVSSDVAGPMWASSDPVKFVECDRKFKFQSENGARQFYLGALFTQALGATDCWPTAPKSLLTTFNPTNAIANSIVAGGMKQVDASSTEVTAPSDDVVAFVLKFNEAVKAGVAGKKITVMSCGPSLACANKEAVYEFDPAASNVVISSSTVTLYAPSKLVYVVGTNTTKKIVIQDGALMDASSNEIVCNGGKWNALGTACDVTANPVFVQDSKGPQLGAVSATSYGASRMVLNPVPATVSLYENFMLTFVEPVLTNTTVAMNLAFGSLASNANVPKTQIGLKYQHKANATTDLATSSVFFNYDGTKMALVTNNDTWGALGSGTMELKITESSNIQDLMGNTMDTAGANTSLTTFTVAAIDTAPPTLFFTEPGQGQLGVSTGSWFLTAVWSEKVQAGTGKILFETAAVSATCLARTSSTAGNAGGVGCGYTGSAGGCVPSSTSVTWQSSGVLQVDVVGGTALVAGCDYKVTFEQGALKDLGGNDNALQTVTFTAGYKTASDTTAPDLSTSIPADNAKGVSATNLEVKVSFTETVMPHKMAGVFGFLQCNRLPCATGDSQAGIQVTLTDANVNWPFGTVTTVGTAGKVYFYGKSIVSTFAGPLNGTLPRLHQSVTIPANSVMDKGFNLLPAVDATAMNFQVAPDTAPPTFLSCDGLNVAVSALSGAVRVTDSMLPSFTCYTTSIVAVNTATTMAYFHDISGDNSTAAVVSRAADGKSITFTSPIQLKESLSYGLKWDAGLFKDSEGTPCLAYTAADGAVDAIGNAYLFKTAALGTALAVSYFYPHTTAASMYDQVRAVFNVAVTPVAGKYIRLSDATSTREEIEVTSTDATKLAYSQDMTRVWFGLGSLLVPNTAYTVTIDAGAFKDVAGRAMAAYTWTFTPSQVRDQVAPTPFLVGKFPVNARGAFDALATTATKAKVYMSERVSAGGATTATWTFGKLSGSGCTVAKTTVSSSATVTKAVVEIDAEFGTVAACVYGVITSEADVLVDMTGNKMAAVAVTSVLPDPASGSTACSATNDPGCAAYSGGMTDASPAAAAAVAAAPTKVYPNYVGVALQWQQHSWLAPSSSSFLIRFSAAVALTNTAGKFVIKQAVASGTAPADMEISVTDTTKVKLMSPLYTDVVIFPPSPLTSRANASVVINVDSVYAYTSTAAGSLADGQKCCKSGSVAWNTAGDVHGTHAAPYVSGGGADSTAPTLSSVQRVGDATTPSLTGGKSWPLNPTVQFTFSEAITYTAGNAFVSAATEMDCAASGSVLTCRVLPPAILAPSTSYYFNLTARAVWDTAGNAAAAMASTAFTFTTMSQDVTAPVTYLSSPAQGYSSASAYGDVVYVFSEKVSLALTAGFTIAGSAAAAAVSGQRLTLKRASSTTLPTGSQPVVIPGSSVTDMTGVVATNKWTASSHSFSIATLGWAGTLATSATAGYNTTTNGLAASEQGSLVVLPNSTMYMIGGRTASGCNKLVASTDSGKTWFTPALVENVTLAGAVGVSASYHTKSKSIFLVGGKACDSGAPLPLRRLVISTTSVTVTSVSMQTTASRTAGVWARGGTFAPKDGMSLAVLGEWQIFIAGGTTSVWRSENVEGTVWKELKNAPFGMRMYPFLAATRSNTLYVVGGWDLEKVGTYAGKDTWYKNTWADVWQTSDYGDTFSMTTANWKEGLTPRSWFSGAVLPDDTLAIVGGLQYNTSTTLTTESLLSTAGTKDTVAPKVVLVTSTARLATQVKLYFDEAVMLSAEDGAEFGEPNIAVGTLTYSGDTAAQTIRPSNKGQVSLSKDKHVVTITPATLTAGKAYTLVLGKGFVKDVAGNLLSDSSTRTLTTTTTDVVGPAAPSWTGLYPANNAMDVPAATSVMVTFKDSGIPLVAQENAAGATVVLATDRSKALVFTPADSNYPPVYRAAKDAVCVSGKADTGVATTNCVWSVSGLVNGQRYSAALQTGSFQDSFGTGSAARTWAFTVLSGSVGGSYKIVGTEFVKGGNMTVMTEKVVPVVQKSWPNTGATDLDAATGFDLKINFTENVMWNTSGVIKIHETNVSLTLASNSVPIRTLAWNSTVFGDKTTFLRENGTWAYVLLSQESTLFKAKKRYYIVMEQGMLVDMATAPGNKAAASSIWFETLAKKADKQAPEILASSPYTGNTAGVTTWKMRMSKLRVFFTEPVTMKDASVVKMTYPSLTAPATIAASQVSLDAASASVTVAFNASAIDASMTQTLTATLTGVVEDAAKNFFNATTVLSGSSGSGTVTWKLTAVSTVKPTLTTSSLPVTETTFGYANEVTEMVQLVFNSPVQAGTGMVKLMAKYKSGDFMWDVATATEADGFVFSGANLLLWPTAGMGKLQPGEVYSVVVDAGAIVDANLNAYDSSSLAHSFSTMAQIQFTTTNVLPSGVAAAAAATYSGCKTDGNGECDSTLFVVGGSTWRPGNTSALTNNVWYLKTSFDAACGTSYPPFAGCGGDICKDAALAPPRKGVVFVQGGVRGRQCRDASGNGVNKLGVELATDPFRPACQCPACIEPLFDAVYQETAAVPSNLAASSLSMLQNLTQTAAMTEVAFKCAAGYTNKTNIRGFYCGVDPTTQTLGRWSTPYPTCAEQNCTVPQMSNADTSACGTEVASGSSCSVTCSTGYESGSAQQFSWQCDKGVMATAQVCQKVTCDALTVQNGDAGACSGKKWGETCDVTCNSGFDGGSATYTCGSDKQFTAAATALTCTAQQCKVADLPATTGTTAAGCASDVDVNGECTLQCASGFSGAGVVMSCGAAASGVAWTAAGTCTKTTCDVAAVTITNGLVSRCTDQTPQGLAGCDPCDASFTKSGSFTCDATTLKVTQLPTCTAGTVPVVTVEVVTGDLTLQGLTAADFADSATGAALKATVVNTLAKTFGVDPAYTTITGVARRLLAASSSRFLQGGVTVTYQVEVPQGVTADSLTAAVTTLVSNAAAFTAELKTAIQADPTLNAALGARVASITATFTPATKGTITKVQTTTPKPATNPPTTATTTPAPGADGGAIAGGVIGGLLGLGLIGGGGWYLMKKK